MRRTEEHFNTREQATSYLRTTLEVLESVSVPEDLREVAFSQVYQSVSGKQVFFEQPQRVGIPPGLLGNGR